MRNPSSHFWIISYMVIMIVGFSGKISALSNSKGQFEEKYDGRKAYIVGTFFTGLGEHINHANTKQGTGTAVEWIKGGTVPWSKLEETTKDTTVSWPLMFDIKFISKYGFGLTFGDLMMISMNKDYQDANHIYFGFSYIHPIKRWDFGASLIVFPVYIIDDALIAGKLDISHWFIDNIGITMSTMFGGTTHFSDVEVLLFCASVGISLKF